VDQVLQQKRERDEEKANGGESPDGRGLQGVRRERNIGSSSSLGSHLLVFLLESWFSIGRRPRSN
jgi:hypothetical protein